MNAKTTITVFIISFLILDGCATAPTNDTQAPTVGTELQFLVVQDNQLIRSVGAPYPIEVDNCNGGRDSEKIEERSKTYITEMDIAISDAVAAEVGGSVEVAKMMLSREIGLELGIRIGALTEERSSVKIVTPAGYKTVTHLQWEEVWTSGSIAINRPDGTYIDALPFSVLNSLTLEQLDSQIVNCETGVVVEAGATAQISTPEIPVIPPTPMPVSIGTISVPGNSSEGTKFTATKAGIYAFKYTGGSYSTYPESKKPPAGTLTWLTAVRVFKNRPVEWNGIAISNYSDYRAVDYAYYASASEVENIAKGSVLTVSLLQGDYLIFVAVDELPYYSDNPGEITFEVFYAPN